MHQRCGRLFNCSLARRVAELFATSTHDIGRRCGGAEAWEIRELRAWFRRDGVVPVVTPKATYS